MKLYSRTGNDLIARFPRIVEALAQLRSRSCIIDGEAVACDDNGVASFDRIRHRHHDKSVFLYAFDVIEMNGDDLRRALLEGRKATLAMILAKASPGIERAYCGGRPDRFRPRVQARLRGHCVEAEGFHLSLGAIA